MTEYSMFAYKIICYYYEESFLLSLVAILVLYPLYYGMSLILQFLTKVIIYTVSSKVTRERDMVNTPERSFLSSIRIDYVQAC